MFKTAAQEYEYKICISEITLTNDTDLCLKLRMLCMHHSHEYLLYHTIYFFLKLVLT